MKRRILALLLCAFTLLPLLASCAAPKLNIPEETEESTVTVATTAPDATPTPKPNPSTKEEETDTEPEGMIPQSLAEQKITKILIIGNSHTNDVFFQLGRVFDAQFEGRYMLGFLYYSGCKLSQHVSFLKNNKPVYDYYKTSTTAYVREEECTMQRVLKDEPWDVIFLNPAGASDLLHEDLQLEFRRQIEDYIHKNVKTEHSIAWHTSWASPNDPAFFDKSWWRQPPAGHKESLIQNYGFDPVNQHTLHVEAVKKHILTDPTYVHTICTGTGIVYANWVLGVPQLDLYRDYTHLSDFGRVLAAYCFYAQFTGEPIEEVLLDKVPAKARQSHYQSLGDLVLTDELKAVIKETANYTLENPWSVPAAK
ncbi:MAG: DUF4886 domain-containing protein [Clostridia bacterium]|nr:DUF4886 domain-containing protein [Clostridia bacterium]